MPLPRSSVEGESSEPLRDSARREKPPVNRGQAIAVAIAFAFGAAVMLGWLASDRGGESADGSTPASASESRSAGEVPSAGGHGRRRRNPDGRFDRRRRRTQGQERLADPGQGDVFENRGGPLRREGLDGRLPQGRGAVVFPRRRRKSRSKQGRDGPLGKRGGILRRGVAQGQERGLGRRSLLRRRFRPRRFRARPCQLVEGRRGPGRGHNSQGRRGNHRQAALQSEQRPAGGQVLLRNVGQLGHGFLRSQRARDAQMIALTRRPGCGAPTVQLPCGAPTRPSACAFSRCASTPLLRGASGVLGVGLAALDPCRRRRRGHN